MKKAFALFLTITLTLFACAQAATCETGTFPWRGHSAYISHAPRGESAGSSTAEPGGAGVQVILACADGTFSWDDITNGLGDFALRDAAGTEHGTKTFVLEAVEGSSRNIADLSTNRYVGFTPIFDLPADTDLDQLTLVVKDGQTGEIVWTKALAEIPSQPQANIPDELIGTWTGTGRPVGGGPEISLRMTVEADGTGEYTFEQSGYSESYPFSLASDGERFSVDIPADNQLGIAKVEGTYAYAGGVLSLAITTTFSSGRQFEYAAECVKDAAPSEAASALAGEWVLESIRFYTPVSDNGIYKIDGTMSISEGYPYGRSLALSADGTAASDVNLNALVKAVPELPFETDDLDLSEYAGWAVEGESLTFSPDGPALIVAHDEAAKTLSLTSSGEVEIQSMEVNGASSKTGTVAIEITMTFAAK